MKLRTARKIWNAIGGEREACYSSHQLDQAIACVERTRDSRAAHAHWDAMMAYMGPVGRARALAGHSRMAEAFTLLMETPVRQWAGDKHAFERYEAKWGGC